MKLQYPYLECGYFMVFAELYHPQAGTLPVKISWAEEISDYAKAHKLLPKDCFLTVDPVTAEMLGAESCYPAYLKADEPKTACYLLAGDTLYPVGYSFTGETAPADSELREPDGASSGSGSGSGIGSGSGSGIGSGSGSGIGSGSGSGIGPGAGLGTAAGVGVGSGSGSGIGSGSGSGSGIGSGIGSGSGSGIGSGSGSGAAASGENPDNLRNSDGGWHESEGGYGLNLIG